MCCSTIGLDASHPYYRFVPKDIMPDSVWNLKHRPADPSGGYVYLKNYTGTNACTPGSQLTAVGFANAKCASGKAWVHIYPSTLASGIALVSQAIKTAGNGNATESMTYAAMRSALEITYARPLHDGDLFTTKNATGSASNQTNTYLGYNICSNEAPSSSAPGSTGPAAVASEKLVSEYCAAVQGTPDVGTTAGCSGDATANTTHDCKFLSSGGFTRNSKSIISNIGVWAGIGYLYTDIDSSLTQQGFNNTYRLVAGGYSDTPSSDFAVPGSRDSRYTLTKTYTHFGARGASLDVRE
jgi:hypothetical protein